VESAWILEKSIFVWYGKMWAQKGTKKKKKVFPSKNKRVCSPRPKESSIALSLKNPKLLQHNKTENREDLGVG
jgi:hypothetical protein